MAHSTTTSLSEYINTIGKHSHHEVSLASFSADGNDTLKITLEVDQMKALSKIIDDFLYPKDGAEVDDSKSSDNTTLYPNGVFLLAYEGCECGDHNPIPLVVRNNEIFFIDIPSSPICDNKDLEENKEILNSLFQEIEIMSPESIIQIMLTATTLRTSQARGLRDRLRDTEQELAKYIDAIAKEFLTKFQ
jgi:hypothetical protein